MSDSGTTSNLFINGAGLTINVGDNVGIVKAGANTYMFNLMGNAFDLHDYQTKDLASAIEGATTVEGALGALSAHTSQNTANFASAFSEVTSYAVGDYVTYNNVLYRCTTAHTAGIWVAGHFTQVTVGGEITHPHAIKESTHPSSLNVTTTKIDVDSATFTSTRSGKLLVMANNIHYTKNGAYQLVLYLEVGSQKQEILSVAAGEGLANGCAIFNVEANQVNTVKITALLSGADSSTSATVRKGYSSIQITMVML